MIGGTVVCMGNFELPDRNAAANRVVNNARLMRTLGLNTVFLGTCRGGDYYNGVQWRDYGAGFDMYEQAYPHTSKQWAEQIFRVDNLNEVVRRYPDASAVLLYNTQYATALAAKRAFAPKGLKLLYDCTEWNAYTEGSVIKRAVKAADSRMVESRLPRVCDGMIAVSRTIEKRYAGKTPLLLLPPLVDLDDPIWQQQPRESDRFTFCYAGSPSDKDRLDLLLEAFLQLPPGAAELRVVGVTRDEYLNVRETAAPFADRPDVCFTGRVPHAEAVREILGCGCFVFLREPSRRNSAGFPTKFTEAFTCGVPVITTAVSDVPAYADDACIVLPNASADGVLGAMREMLARGARPRALRNAFDYRNHTEAFRCWLERIACTPE